MFGINKKKKEEQKAREFSQMRFQNYHGAPSDDKNEKEGRGRRNAKPRDEKAVAQKTKKISKSTEEKVNQDAPTFQLNTTLSAFHGETRGEKSERQRERNSQSRRRKLSIVFVFAAILLGLFLMIMTQFSGRLTTVTSNAPSLDVASAETYKSLAEEYLADHPFERFSFLRRDKALAEFMVNKAPEIQNVKISSSGLASSKLEMEFRSPIAMWTDGVTTSYVDASGVVFARNHFAEPGVTIADNSGLAPIDGVAASARFLSFIGRVISEIAQQNVGAVERVVIPRGAIRYVEFYLAGRAYPFRAQIDRDPISQAADITNMARYLDANGITPSYADVRVVGKGFWK